MITTLSKKTALIPLLLIFCISCKKNEQACWQAFSPMGEDVDGLILCDKTKSEAEAAYPLYWFYNSTEPKYCWHVQMANGDVHYASNIPQSMASMYAMYGQTFTKVTCGSFCVWHVLEKSKSKITGLYQPNQEYVETLLTADTCSTLYVGRVVTYRETTDSLITREFIEKIQ